MDRPNDGQVKFNVDVGALGVCGYDVVTPASNYAGDGGGGDGGGEAAYSQRLESNRLLRILERTLLIGGSIDAEALCIQSGVWVWRLVVDVSLVCDAGNALDASVLAAVAALRHFRLAQVDMVDNDLGDDTFREMRIIDSDEKEPTPLPLHHTPVTATFALFSDNSGATSTVATLLDPTDREELAADGVVSWSYNKYGEMCCLDFPGGCELSTIQLMSSSDLGKKRCIEICEMLETALLEADNKAQKERMQRLKKSAMSLDVVPTATNEDSPMSDVDDVADTKAEDEEYRKIALDYASGHIAAAVKDKPLPSKSKKAEASSLFHAFLRSVKKTDETRDHMDVDSSKMEEDQVSQPEITTQSVHQFVAQQNAEVKQQSFGKAQKMVVGDSSDEDEQVILLQTEFTPLNGESIDAPKTEINASDPKKVQQQATSEIDDVEDLAMAVKKKKSKKSKKKGR